MIIIVYSEFSLKGKQITQFVQDLRQTSEMVSRNIFYRSKNEKKTLGLEDPHFGKKFKKVRSLI